MSRLSRRPSRTQSRRMLSSLSIAFFALLAIVCLCPVSVAAEEKAKSEYGTVIGIDLGTTYALQLITFTLTSSDVSSKS
ncbi:hypothetical protein HGRIS_006838 [Hohenbuehelia grisea]|uniref:Uncharacterized protein n=1 Tax=Hohenbuehelia grisea TaxID=104357 RepID=A0ABR3JAJ0_9AGAR